MTETLDISELLPRNTPVVNRFRLQHGDLEGFVKDGIICNASQKDNSALGELIRRGFLEQWHKEAAMGFLELQHSYRASGRCKSNGIYLSQMFGGSGDGNDALLAYSRISKRMGKELPIIESASAESFALEHPKEVEIISMAFELLVKISDEVWSEIQDKKKDACLQ